jgi:thiol:disulfide interchange protein
MKPLKVILGSVCLALAVLIGTVVSVHFKFPTDLPLGIAGCWLAIVGGFVIVRRHTPMSKAGRVWLVFSLGSCGLLALAGILNLTSSLCGCIY